MAFRLSVCVAAWLLLCATPVWAAPGSAERETARSLMRNGDRLSDAGDPAGALERYQEAHALMHVPTTGLAVAQTQARLGHLVEARSAALEVASMPVEDNEPPVFGSARTAAAELLEVLEPRVCTIETRVTPSAAEYSLQIDDVVLPEAARAVPFKTNPGLHTLRVLAPGYLPATREISLAEGALQHVELTLQPEPAPQLPAATPPPDPLTPAQAAYASQQLDGARHSGRVRGYIGLGMGGAALVAGAITGILSWTQALDISKRCDTRFACAPSERDALQQANTLAHVANVAVPLGLVGIAYGLYELFTLPDAPPPTSHAALRIELTPSAIVLRGAL